MNRRVLIWGIIAGILLLISGLFFLYRSEIRHAWQQKVTDSSFEVITADLAREITPPPLRNDSETKNARLTVEGVLTQTNKHRTENSRKPLALNEQLNEAAQMKLNDMFAQQYFAHQSPAGKGPSSLADRAGYQYVVIGENLALGNFENDAVLVEGWMNSPGHRENILHSRYTEIGIAVGQGVFEGKRTWLAVQEFGLPASACPKPDPTLEAFIKKNQADLDQMEIDIEAKKQEVETAKKNNDPAYPQKVGEYNELIRDYNQLIQHTKSLVSDYNERVQKYNTCLKESVHE